MKSTFVFILEYFFIWAFLCEAGFADEETTHSAGTSIDRQAQELAQEAAISVRLIPLSQAAGWFFRPFPYSSWASYAGNLEHAVGSPSSPNGNVNRMVDLSTGKEIAIPGKYDPVPTPDERFMTTPLDVGLTFYDTKSLINGQPKEVFVDKQMSGVYQSIGLLNLFGGNTSYRVITDMNGLNVRDYEAEPSGQIIPIGNPHSLCSDRDLSLPMLSKDGRFLAAMDLKTHTTKIFNIDNDRCDEKVDLQTMTGKVDFSYDGRFITYHKIEKGPPPDPNNPYPRTPSDDNVINIYRYDLQTGKRARLTNNSDSNAVFPAFRRNGDIVFILYPHHPADNVVSSLQEVNPEITVQ